MPGGEGPKAPQHREAPGDDGEGLEPHAGVAETHKIDVPRALTDAQVSVPQQAVCVGVRNVRAAMEGAGVHGRCGRRLDWKGA